MLNGPRTCPNTFSTPSTTSWCSAATSDLPVMGATLGMMTSSFVCGGENEAMPTLLCHSMTGNALSSEKSGTEHCELRRKCALFFLMPRMFAFALPDVTAEEHRIMSIGTSVPLPAYTIDPAFMAKKAEDLGFESIWYAEHPAVPVHSTSPFPATGGEIPWTYSHFTDPYIALARASGVT